MRRSRGVLSRWAADVGVFNWGGLWKRCDILSQMSGEFDKVSGTNNRDDYPFDRLDQRRPLHWKERFGR